MVTENVPARLKVLFAPQVGKAVILRRGPAKQVCTIGWDFNDDSFQMGQWLKGAIRSDSCDLSPDGKHLIYSAAKYLLSEHDFKYYTVLSRAPYLKALKMDWTEGLPYDRGFLDARRLWINEYYGHTDQKFRINIYQLPGLKILQEAPELDELESMRKDVWLFLNWRRKRDGWSEEHTPEQSTTAWTKQIRNWKLSKTTFLHSQHKDRRSNPWIMECEKTGESFDTTNWNWADIYEKRLLFACEGKLFAVRMWEDGHGPITLLRDFNDMVFEPIAAPY